MTRFPSWQLWPWIVGWPNIIKVTGLSRSWLEKLGRYRGFPIRFGPTQEVRVHSLEVWTWVIPSELHPDENRRPKDIGYFLEDSPLLGLERLLLSGWGEISAYLGYRSRETAARWHREFRLPCWRIGGRPRSIPGAIDIWLKAWDEMQREKRKRHYGR